MQFITIWSEFNWDLSRKVRWNIVSIDLGDGLAPNGWHVITWTNDSLVYGRIYASLGLIKLSYAGQPDRPPKCYIRVSWKCVGCWEIFKYGHRYCFYVIYKCTMFPMTFRMVAPCVWKRSDMSARILHVIVSRSRPEMQIWTVGWYVTRDS